MSKENGSIGPICVCLRVTQLIHLIDPRTLKSKFIFIFYFYQFLLISIKKVIEINADAYWRQPFQTICSPKQLREYTIMDIEKSDNKPHVYGKESTKVKV